MRPFSEEVAGDESPHTCYPAVVVTQVEDERVAVGQEIHRRARRGCADVRVSEEIELQVADVRLQVLCSLESAIAGAQPRVRCGISRGRPVRPNDVAEPDFEM